MDGLVALCIAFPDGERRIGTLRALTPDSLTINWADGGTSTVSRPAVMRLKARQGRRRERRTRPLEREPLSSRYPKSSYAERTMCAPGSPVEIPLYKVENGSIFWVDLTALS